MVEGLELACRVCWDYYVLGREWEEALAVLLPELRSRSYYERLGGL
jgi:hypothetical protein